MHVPFFSYPRVFTSSERELLEIIRQVGRRGAFIMQEDLRVFEENIAKFTGARFALGVGNATDALELLLSAAGISGGDEVIVCSHTLIATASAVQRLGARAVPVEVGRDSLMDPESAQAAVSSKTKAILPTQLNGRICDMDAIADIATKHGLVIVEDSAQALGATYLGKAAGTFGFGGCISFYPAKSLGSLGDGGVILCNDAQIHEILSMMRDHGRDPLTGEVKMWGRNSRLDNMQAAILNYRLRSFDEHISKRREVARLYHSILKSVKELTLPIGPDDDPERFDVFQNYEIQAGERDALKQYLTDHHIGSIIQWGGKALHQLRHLGFDASLPRTDAFMSRILLLPMNQFLTENEAVYVAQTVKEFYGYE